MNTNPATARIAYSPISAATSPASIASVLGLSHSLAAASSGFRVYADAPLATPSREGGECCPAPIQAFVDTWVSAPPRIIAPRPDYGPQYNGVGECPF